MILSKNKKEKELIEELSKLKEENRNLKKIIRNLCDEQVAIYYRYKQDTGAIIRPIECVKSGCNASCDMVTYEGSKRMFLDDPSKCRCRS